MRLAISIATIGDQPLVLQCLASIESQTSVDHEIHLIANLASPPFLYEIHRRFPEVALVHEEELRSFATNHNQTMQGTNAEYILLLNDDTVILDRALDRMVEFLDGQPGDTGIVGCTNLDGQGNFTLSCFPFPTAAVVCWQHAQLSRWLPGRLYERYLPLARSSEPFPADWVKGSCILIRREVIERIGYLDEDFFLFSEEVDYCYRARQAGFSTYQVPRARILHYESVTTNRFVQTKLQGHYLGKLYFLAKHGFRHDLRLVRAWFIVELLAKSVIRSLGAAIAHPPDARDRLLAYLGLMRMCAIYQGQPVSAFVRPG